jgi:hypothetical protein
MQDSTGNWGGSLILSTTTAGSTSSSSGQPVDRLTIDSSGIATFTAGQKYCPGQLHTATNLILPTSQSALWQERVQGTHALFCP